MRDALPLTGHDGLSRDRSGANRDITPELPSLVEPDGAVDRHCCFPVVEASAARDREILLNVRNVQSGDHSHPGIEVVEVDVLAVFTILAIGTVFSVFSVETGNARFALLAGVALISFVALSTLGSRRTCFALVPLLTLRSATRCAPVSPFFPCEPTTP